MGKKFEKKIDSASEQKLSKMYLSRMDHSPSAKSVEELRLLSDMIPDPVKDGLQYAYYEKALSKINDERFGLLTGYGQCRGSLMVHNGDVVISCCREMAWMVAYQNAHHFRGRIHVPGQKGNACRSNGSVYLISDEMGKTFTECPFCQASIQEQIDFVSFDSEAE